MTTLLGIVGTVLAVLLVVGVCVGLLREMYRPGYEDGYSQGRKEEVAWWTGIETEAKEVRQKIGREEAER